MLRHSSRTAPRGASLAECCPLGRRLSGERVQHEVGVSWLAADSSSERRMQECADTVGESPLSFRTGV